MKKLIILSISLALFFVFNTAQAQPSVSVGYETFYSSLAPYGSWIELDNGVTVWRPDNLSRGWTPYRYGNWLWTNDGWYWNSDEPFGFIVYHYGRWYYDDYYGWIWVPDDVWAPAWVQWRYDNDYIGWAPLPPYANFSIGIGIRFSNSWTTPYSYWHYVSYRHMCDRNVYRYFVPDRMKYMLYSQTRFRTNYGYSDGRVINRGVDVDFVRQRSGIRITERKIERVNNPDQFRNHTGYRGSGSVRAFIISNDRSGRIPENIQVRRGARASTLDFSKVNVGRTFFNRQNRTPEMRREENRGSIEPQRGREVNPYNNNRRENNPSFMERRNNSNNFNRREPQRSNWNQGRGNNSNNRDNGGRSNSRNDNGNRNGRGR